MFEDVDTTRASLTRVLLAGGGELVRRGIRDVLERSGSFVVAGEVAAGGDLSPVCASPPADLSVVCLGPDDTIDALPGELSGSVLVLLDQPSGDQALEALATGAGGVLLLDAPADALLDAAREVANGGVALDPRLLAPLFGCLRRRMACACSEAGDAGLDATVLQRLSPREGDVLRLLTHGKRNKQISAQLGVSVGTVKTHLRHVFRKLDVADRTGAVLAAMHRSRAH